MMAKNDWFDYDTTASNNTDVDGVDISEGCAPSGINNALRALMANTADVFNGGAFLWADAGGTADAITADFTPDVTLNDGLVVGVRAAAANATTTPTFAPDGLTAYTIVKTGGNALVAGDIAGDGHELLLRYDSANTQWELLNPALGGLPYLSMDKGSDLASAGTLVIGTDGGYFDVTGTTTITGMTVAAGRMFTLQFDGALTLTHGAFLNLPGGANITTAAGDEFTFYATAADTVRCIGYALASGEAIVSGSTQTSPRSHIAGLTLTNNGTDSDHDIDIAAGEARDDADTEDMTLASAITKQIDAAWSVGDNAGGLDTGSVGQDVYAVWLIKRTDTGVVDVLFSASFSSPTMPTNYDKKRLIGAVVTNASANIIAFVQRGDYFELTGSLVTDVNDSTMTADTYEVGTLSVPPNSMAEIIAHYDNETSVDDRTGVLYIRRNGSSEAAGTRNDAWFQHQGGGGGNKGGGMRGRVLVDGSSQIQYAVNEQSGAATVSIKTLGFQLYDRSVV